VSATIPAKYPESVLSVRNMGILIAVAEQCCAPSRAGRPIRSQDDVTAVDFEANCNLIWAGLSFTQVSRDLARAWLTHPVKFLSPRTFISARRVVARTSKFTPCTFIAPESRRDVPNGYRQTGYGHCHHRPVQNYSLAKPAEKVSRRHIIAISCTYLSRSSRRFLL